MNAIQCYKSIEYFEQELELLEITLKLGGSDTPDLVERQINAYKNAIESLLATSDYTIELILSEGDQFDLESAFEKHMLEKAKTMDFSTENPWGEFYVIQGDIIHGIQWSFINFEDVEVTESGSFNTDNLDIQIDCSWHVE